MALFVVECAPAFKGGLMSNEDSASIYNKVVLNSENGTLNADRVDYDFDTKYYKITMFNDDKVKLKLIK